MKTWSTEVKAKSPVDGSIKTYCGPNIEAETLEEAQEYCENNGLGYCWVIGQLICEIPTLEDGLTPDFDNQVSYED